MFVTLKTQDEVISQCNSRGAIPAIRGVGGYVIHFFDQSKELQDNFSTAERLFENNFEVLEIQSKYYEDLATRFDLSDSLIDRLQKWNILYDVETGSTFFQLYSKPYGEGLFFEIVQREKGYDGYGAPNAPFGISALRRFLRPAGVPRI